MPGQSRSNNHDQTPPLPPSPASRTRKRPRTTEQTLIGSRDAPIRTPPQSSGNIVIREPAAQTGMNVTSTSWATSTWQPSSLLDDKPLPTTASVQVWEKGEGGRVAQILVHSLLLLEDVHTFEDGTYKSLGRQLQSHTIAIILCSPFLYIYWLLHAYYSCCRTYHCCFARLPNWPTSSMERWRSLLKMPSRRRL